MTIQYIRRRNTTVAVKAETTPGTDAFGGAAPSAATDFVKADVQIAFNQQQIQDPSLTGSLDNAPPIPGGTKVQVTLTIPLRGSGAPGTPPQWGKLMPMCTWKETITAAAIGAPTAASAGSENSVTLGAPFAQTAQIYRGMPLILSGNPAGGASTFITDYTSGGVATLATKFGTALDATTEAEIPINVLYSPTSDENDIKTGTMVIFMDGLQFKFTGASGAWKLALATGGLGTLTFTMDCQYQDPVGGSAPAGIVFDVPQPVVFRDGLCRLNGALARVSQASFDSGATVYDPENPEALMGFDPAIVTSRAVTGSMDPLMSVTDTIARVQAFKAGTAQTVAAGLGTVAGNRFGIVIPSGQYTGLTPNNRNDLMAETLPFAANGIDSSLFLTCF